MSSLTSMSTVTKPNKLEDHHENPFDIVCLKVAEFVAPFFKRLGLTPNFITTLSVIASFFAIWNVYKNGPKTEFVLWSLLAYFFDCLDGHFARRYDMCTKFGDYYDHVSDWLYFIGLFYVAFWVKGLNSFGRQHKFIVYAAIVISALGMMFHMGLQEMVFGAQQAIKGLAHKTKTDSPTLNIFTRFSELLCQGSAEECIKISRWLGVGTFIGLTTLIILVAIK
jgi:phosphatidylglycerophosphate synthase